MSTEENGPGPEEKLLSEEDVRRLQALSAGASRSPLLSSGSLAGAPRFKPVREIGRAQDPPLVAPLAVALEPGGNLLVLDQPGPAAFRIRRFCPDGSDGATVAEFAKGPGDDELLGPIRFSLDVDRRLYILDSAASAVKKYAADGRWLDTFSTAGPDDAGLNGPRDLDVDGRNDLYIADTNNDRVVKMRSDGEPAWTLDQFEIAGETEELYEPASVCAGPDGTVYVADSNNNRIVCSTAHRKVSVFLGADKRFSFPSLVRVSADGRLVYVSDQGDNRIQRFDLAGRRTGSIILGSQSEESSQAGADWRIDGAGHLVLVNLLRQSIVILEFVEG